jgi:hypothetical protein
MLRNSVSPPVPGGRQLERVQHARGRRFLDIGHVGVPDAFAIAERTDRLASVVENIADHADFRVTVDQFLAGAERTRRQFRLAEELGEHDLFLVAEFEAAEAQHQMVEPCLADALGVIPVHLGDVETDHVGAQRSACGYNAEVVAHVSVSLCIPAAARLINFNACKKFINFTQRKKSPGKPGFRRLLIVAAVDQFL